jgi:hypothetical protein
MTNLNGLEYSLLNDNILDIMRDSSSKFETDYKNIVTTGDKQIITKKLEPDYAHHHYYWVMHKVPYVIQEKIISYLTGIEYKISSSCLNVDSFYKIVADKKIPIQEFDKTLEDLVESRKKLDTTPLYDN